MVKRGCENGPTDKGLSKIGALREKNKKCVVDPMILFYVSERETASFPLIEGRLCERL